MKQAMMTTPQIRPSRGLACLFACSVALACGPSGPPLRAAEVPIDQFQPTPAPAPGVAAAPEAVAAPVAATGTPQAGGDRPAPLATQPPAPTPTPAVAPVPAGQRLTPAECTKLTDKGALLYGASTGLSAAKAARALTTLRSKADADPTYARVHNSCLDQVSKTQLQCASKTTSLDKWKACLE